MNDVNDFELAWRLERLQTEYGPIAATSTALALVSPRCAGEAIERRFLQLSYTDRMCLLATLSALADEGVGRVA